MQKCWPVAGVGMLVALAVVAVSPAAPAQDPDYSVLRINEIIAENDSTGPADVGGGFTDMVEIYNSGTQELEIGFSNKFFSLSLTDTDALPEDPYTFTPGTKILPEHSIVVFCDSNTPQNTCEPHAAFQLSSDGSEPVTLWGPVIGTDGQGRPVRAIIDQVWLPPLRSNVSVGRFPDGAGPAPVPLDQVLDVFVYHPPGTSTFGTCVSTPTNCGDGLKKRTCLGAPNAPGGNINPRVGIETYSTNTPAAGEPVTFRVKVDDEQGPSPPNIARVEIRYRVSGGAEQTVVMTYDASSGVQQGVLRDVDGQAIGPNPFDFWAYYDGSIPGQAAGSVVDFSIHVRDADGGEDSTPGVLCGSGVGPCDREFGGPGCEIDPADTACDPPVAHYRSCRTPFHYVVAHTVRAEVAPLVINEVVAAQLGVLTDVTEGACSEEEMEACPDNLRNCCPVSEDFIELFNSSSTQTIDLSGLWLSDGPFNPQVWKFPEGASILPGEYLIIWLDRDGGMCPDPTVPEAEQPCFWECPDPTTPGVKEYHTNFALNADGDEIFLFDTAANKLGVIHGVRFADLNANQSLSLAPNGQKAGCWVVDGTPTPRAANDVACEVTKFQRGDSTSNCNVDISDAIFTLNFLFAGTDDPLCPDGADSNDDGKVDLSDAVFVLGFLFLGSAEPPAPGPTDPGPDPSEDALEACVAPPCG